MVIEKRYSKRLGKEVWGYDGRVSGKRKRDFRFATKKQAEDAVAATRTKAINEDYGFREKSEPTTIKMAIDNYKQRYMLKSQSKDLAYQQNMAATFNRLQEFANLVGEEFLLRKINSGHLQMWATKMRVSPASLNTYAGRLSGVFQMAKQTFTDLGDWMIPKVNEFAPSPNKRRDRIINPREASILVNALLKLPPAGPRMSTARHRHLTETARDAADAFRIALATGMRLNEILKRSLEDFKGGKIYIRQTKTSTDRTIPLPDSVSLIIEQRKKEGLTRNGHLFPRKFEKHHYVGLLEQTMARIAKRNGIVYGRKNGGFTVHDARATYITNLLRGNPDKGIPAISIGTVMARSGHKSLSGVQHYIRLVEEEQEVATQASESLVEQMMAGLIAPTVTPIGVKRARKEKAVA